MMQMMQMMRMMQWTANPAASERSAASSWTWDEMPGAPHREDAGRPHRRRRRTAPLVLQLGLLALAAATAITGIGLAGERDASAHAGVASTIRIPSSVAHTSGVDQRSVQRIFLNAKAQRWLKQAAVADVGEAAAQRYFRVLRHEAGHTAHMHVRFGCPAGHGRCVNSPT
jgi:hypothetical protein